jgi:protocatechuate 3,4-dioxygenase beta subunit
MGMTWLSLFLCPGSFPAQQAAAQQIAVVEGRVVDLVSGQTLQNARLILSGDNGYARGTTDNSGNFKLDDVPAGDYRVEVTREGYVWSRRQSGPTMLTLVPGQQLKNVSFGLLKTSAITGRVLDGNGDPAAGIAVAALTLEYRNGRRGLTVRPSIRPGSRLMVSTDRDGEYRLYGLEPGDYYLRVTTGATTSLYYPGTTDPNLAAPLQVQAGRDLVAGDFRLRRVPEYSFRFAITDAQALSRATEPFPWYIRPRDPASVAGWTSIRISPIGGNRFQGAALPAGAYELSWMVPFAPFLFGHLVFDIKDGDVDAGTLTVTTGVTLNGTIRMSEPKAMSLRLIPTNGSQMNRLAYTSTDGAFSIGNVTEGDYWITLEVLPRDAYIQSIHYATRPAGDGDITVGKEAQGTLEVVIAGTGGIATGTVRNERGEPIPFASVLIFPARGRPRSPALIKIAETDARGVFTVYGLAPGAYRAMAWDDALPHLHSDPAFMDSIEVRATGFTILEKLSTVLDLRVAPTAN